jgi:ATP adenylyltransferase
MDQLWAPWRLSYISRDPLPKDGDVCFICRGLAEADDRKNLIVERTNLAAVILNRFPYNNGHLLIAPKAHKGRLDELTADETLELQHTVARMIALLEKEMHPEGFNVGLNLGKVAGAGLPGHLHWHVVPRWNGDTNFMPVLADVRVIAQSLDALYDLLSSILKRADCQSRARSETE